MGVAPPEQLVEDTRSGRAVLFAGAGMSRPQLPGWSDLLTGMLDWALRQQIPLDADDIRDLINKADLLLAAQALYSAIGDAELCAYLKSVFRCPGLKPEKAHRLIPSIPFAAIVTTNYDTLIEDAFSPAPPKYTQLDAPELAHWMRSPHLAVIKAHGDVDRCDSIVLTQRDYRELKFASEHFRVFLTNLFTSYTVVFAGYSLSDPDLLLFLEQLQFAMRGKMRPHYAIMRTRGMNPYKRRSFETQYGVRILGDDALDGYPEIGAFLKLLPTGQAAAGPPAPAIQPLPGVRTLLEAMGYRVLDEQGPYSLCEYRAGAEPRLVVAGYCPEAPGDAEVDALHQVTQKFRVQEAMLLAEAPAPPHLAREAAERGVRIWERQRFIDRLADFGPYLGHLRKEYDESGIERFFVPLKARREEEGSRPFPLDDYVEQWLASPDQHHLSLLGDFGTGKTWFCRRLAHKLACAGGRIPILIRLRDYSRAYDIEQLVTDALMNRFQVALPAAFRTFQYLNEEGRLAVIFDGFDEMERRVSDYRTALDNFWEIARLVAPRAKVLLTCRTAYFRHRREEEETFRRERGAVEIAKGEQIIELRDRKGFDLVHLEVFDDDQVRRALELRAPEAWEALYERISKLPNIKDLAQRPVLLEMIAQTLPKIRRPEDMNLATLYRAYTEELLKARVTEIAPEARRSFVRELAWEMQRSTQYTVAHGEFPARVDRHFELKGNAEKIAYYERDIRTQSYLERDGEGNYRFFHASVREYFVACGIAEALARAEAPDCPLTNAIVTFVHYLLAQAHRYQTQIEDGMVYVPPGPFVFGQEEEANLRIGTVRQGYWIDQCPVTNAQYCEFLNAKGHRKEWLDITSSRILKQDGRFSPKSGFEQHPVTGVSWYGAGAYAKWADKRLPAEWEWEKAARGIDGRRYPWGEEFDSGRCNTRESDKQSTTPVRFYGDKGASPYGCHDMAGNVWEWTESLYTEGKDWRVLRGGSWYSVQGSAACAFRAPRIPAFCDVSVGFRCARTS